MRCSPHSDGDSREIRVPDPSSNSRAYRVSAITFDSTAAVGDAGHHGIAVDADDNLHFTDPGKVYRLSRTGTLTTMAGSKPGRWRTADVTTLDLAAEFYYPAGMAFDSKGNAYYTDSWNHVVRKVSRDGTTTSIFAGRWLNRGSDPGASDGDGGDATKAGLNRPRDVAVDSKDNVYIADSENNRIRVVDPTTGVIRTLTFTAGTGLGATGTTLQVPRGLAMDPSTDTLYICDTFHHRVVAVQVQKGTMSLVAGGNDAGWSGDKGPATAAQLNTPRGIELDRDGNLYIADTANHRVRKVDTDGTITTLAGTGSAATVSDDQARSTLTATFPLPTDVAVDSLGNVYVATFASGVVRRIDLSSFVIPSNTAYDFGAGAFTVLAVVSPGTVLTTDETTVATGNIVSRHAPYQKKTGGWELALVTDPTVDGPTDRLTGVHLRYRGHGVGGQEQVAYFPVVNKTLQAKVGGGYAYDDPTFARATHVVVLSRSATGVITLRLNGVLVDGVRTSGTGGGNVSNTEPLAVGRLLRAGQKKDVRGLVRAVCVWSKAFTPTEITNFTHLVANRQIGLKSQFDVTPTYTPPTDDTKGYQVHMAATLTVTTRQGDVTQSEKGDGTEPVTATLAELQEQAAQKLEPAAAPADCTFAPLEDKTPGTATLGVTRNSDQATAELEVRYADVRDANAVHLTLWETLRAKASADIKLDTETRKGQANTTWYPYYYVQPERTELGCVGLWVLRGVAPDGAQLGADLSPTGNAVPADQLAMPDEAMDTVLPFYVQDQRPGNNWCWATVSASVAGFYDPVTGQTDKATVVQQRAQDILWALAGTDLKFKANVIPRALGPSADAASVDYDYYACAALNPLGSFAGLLKGPADISKLRAELRLGHPVVARVAWGVLKPDDEEKHGAHFLVISGTFTDKKGANVVISDPWFGTTTMALADFPKMYQEKTKGGGGWTFTTLTQPAWVK